MNAEWMMTRWHDHEAETNASPQALVPGLADSPAAVVCSKSKGLGCKG
jgi:hypothetical protein